MGREVLNVWKAENLSLLQKRHKWLAPKATFKGDDLVLIVGKDTPRNR